MIRKDWYGRTLYTVRRHGITTLDQFRGIVNVAVCALSQTAVDGYFRRIPSQSGQP